MTHPQVRPRSAVEDLQSRLESLRQTYYVLEGDFGAEREPNSRAGQASGPDATCVAELARVIKAAARATETAAVLLDDEEIIAAAAMASSAADYLCTLVRSAAEQAAILRLGPQFESGHAVASVVSAGHSRTG